MNKDDRQKVSELQAKLEDLKSQIGEIGQELSNMASEEQDKFDNLNEGLQASEQGQGFQNAAEALGEAASYAEEGNAGEAISALEGME